MPQQPVPLLEILSSLGFKKAKHRSYIGKKIQDLGIDGLPDTLLSLKIVSIRKKPSALKICLAAESYPQILEAQAQLNVLASSLRGFFNRSCKIKLIIGQF
jgi:hypothetical protein